MKKIIVLLGLVFLVTSCNDWTLIRKTKKIPASKSIEESKKRGAFKFEYEPDSVMVYDSICVRVRSAFVEYDCRYADWHSSKIVVGKYVDHVVIQYEDGSYPGYYGDTLTCRTDSSFTIWYIRGARSRPPLKSDFHQVNDSLKYIPAPDTLVLPIYEIEYYIDSIFCQNDPYARKRVRKDTIGYLNLVRKKEVAESER